MFDMIYLIFCLLMFGFFLSAICATIRNEYIQRRERQLRFQGIIASKLIEIRKIVRQ